MNGRFKTNQTNPGKENMTEMHIRVSDNSQKDPLQRQLKETRGNIEKFAFLLFGAPTDHFIQYRLFSPNQCIVIHLSTLVSLFLCSLLPVVTSCYLVVLPFLLTFKRCRSLKQHQVGEFFRIGTFLDWWLAPCDLMWPRVTSCYLVFLLLSTTFVRWQSVK